MITSVSEIGQSWVSELIKFSLGLGFHTFGIFPVFRELLNIVVTTGVNIAAYTFSRINKADRLARMLYVFVHSPHIKRRLIGRLHDPLFGD